jgi:hypothetical protein
MTCLHRSLVGFASTVARHIGLLWLTEDEGASSLGKLQGVSHHYVGRREGITRKIGRARELPGNQPQPALKYFQRLAGTPVLPLGLGREIPADDNEVKRGSEAGFAEVKELLVRGEGGIVRSGASGVGP